MVDYTGARISLTIFRYQGAGGDGMIYDLEYDIGSQIVTHTFVNDDYEALSNAKVRNYMGSRKDAFANEQEPANEQKQPEKEDFSKWLR